MKEETVPHENGVQQFSYGITTLDISFAESKFQSICLVNMSHIQVMYFYKRSKSEYDFFVDCEEQTRYRAVVLLILVLKIKVKSVR